MQTATWARRVWRGLFVVYALILAAALLHPQPSAAPVLGELAQLLPLDDKWQHWIAFAGLAALGILSFGPSMLVLCGLLVYGVGLEYAQSFVPGRTVDLWDVIADLGGIAMTLAFFRLLPIAFGKAPIRSDASELELRIRRLETDVRRLQIQSSGEISTPAKVMTATSVQNSSRAAAPPTTAPAATPANATPDAAVAVPGLATLIPMTMECAVAAGGPVVALYVLPFRVGRECRKATSLTIENDERRTGTTPHINDLYLWEQTQDVFVSREHFQIELANGEYSLFDRGSTLGTWVEGRLVGGRQKGGRMPLKDNDVIIVGSYRSGLIFKFLAPRP